MQYGQRKLQRSMTEIRRSRNGRLARSFTLAKVCQCATECVMRSLVGPGATARPGSLYYPSHIGTISAGAGSRASPHCGGRAPAVAAGNISVNAHAETDLK